jgi:hypothetical protein
MASAQQVKDYSKDYFRNPLDIPISLSGGFAECRPNHFHTGIDIKTQQRENMPVHAAADGYISRISISSTGYGNALYINHPNGFTTVYGHLNDFYPELQQYLKKKQYELEKWNVQLFPGPGQFPVKKGQFIAYSGTTGGSTGPHVHFEVRDTKTEHVLNELLFGLPVADTRAPKAEGLAIYNAAKSIYEQDPVLVSTIAQGKDFRIKPSVFISEHPEILIGINARDYTNNSHNWLGIYEMKLYLDNELQLSTRLSELDFAQSRYVNAYADYKTKQKTGDWYQGLYRLPNNKLDIYTYVNGRAGALDISDGKKHAVRIALSDPFGNVSEVNFTAQYNPGDSLPQDEDCPKGTEWNYTEGGTLSTSSVRFTAGPKAFYDNICFFYQETPSTKYWSNELQLDDAAVPIQTYCSLSLKLNKPLPAGLQDKLNFVHHIQPASLPGRNPQNGMAAHYVDGWATAKVRTFGNYYVTIDTVPPAIVPLQKGHNFSRSKHIRFRVTDKMTSVKEFRGQINGHWVCFVRRGNDYTYTFEEHCPKGEDKLEITAIDENGNTGIYNLNFTR